MIKIKIFDKQFKGQTFNNIAEQVVKYVWENRGKDTNIPDDFPSAKGSILKRIKDIFVNQNVDETEQQDDSTSLDDAFAKTGGSKLDKHKDAIVAWLKKTNFTVTSCKRLTFDDIVDSEKDSLEYVRLTKAVTRNELVKYAETLCRAKEPEKIKISAKAMAEHEQFAEIIKNTEQLLKDNKTIAAVQALEWIKTIEAASKSDFLIAQYMSVVKTMSQMTTVGASGAIVQTINRIIKNRFEETSKYGNAIDAMKITHDITSKIYSDLKKEFRVIDIDNFRVAINYQNEAVGNEAANVYNLSSLLYLMSQCVNLIATQTNKLNDSGDVIEKLVERQFVNTGSDLFRNSFRTIKEKLVRAAELEQRERIIELAKKCGSNVREPGAYMLQTVTLFRQILSTLNKETDQKRFAFGYYSYEKGTGKSTMLRRIESFLKKKNIQSSAFTYLNRDNIFTDPVFSRTLLMTNEEIPDMFRTEQYHSVIDNTIADYNIKYGSAGRVKSCATMFYCSNRKGMPERRLFELEFKSRNLSSMDDEKLKEVIATEKEYDEFFEAMFQIALRLDLRQYHNLGAMICRKNSGNELRSSFMKISKYIQFSSLDSIPKIRIEKTINIDKLTFAIYEREGGRTSYDNIRSDVKDFARYLVENNLAELSEDDKNEEIFVCNEELGNIVKIALGFRTEWDSLEKTVDDLFTMAGKEEKTEVVIESENEIEEKVYVPTTNVIEALEQGIKSNKYFFKPGSRNSDIMQCLSRLKETIEKNHYAVEISREEISDYFVEKYDDEEINLAVGRWFENYSEIDSNFDKEKPESKIEISDEEFSIIPVANEIDIETVFGEYLFAPFNPLGRGAYTANTVDGRNVSANLFDKISEFTLESDETSIEEQLNVLDYLEKNRILFHCVYSGNKSLHFTFRFNEPQPLPIALAAREKILNKLESDEIIEKELWDKSFTKHNRDSFARYHRRPHEYREVKENTFETLGILRERGFEIDYIEEKQKVEQKLISGANRLLKIKMKGS